MRRGFLQRSLAARTISRLTFNPRRSHEKHWKTFDGRSIQCHKSDSPFPLATLPHETTEIRSISSREAESTFPPFPQWRQNTFLMKNCEYGESLSVAVLLSGGVDSSVALALLKAAGHKLTAFYLKIWFQEDFDNFWNACPWEDDIRYATQVCDQLNVRLEVIPLSREYWERVTSKTIAAIKSGQTPNPDILCNSQIKFGAFMEFLSKRDVAFDRIASGHYARVTRQQTSPDNTVGVELKMAVDSVKDQTYFLAQLNQSQLSKCLFPLGDLKKTDVRALAYQAQLPTAKRKDSQGICFLGKVNFNGFVESHLGTWPGLILEDGTKKQLGFHNGYWFHTIGQRTGLKLPGGPWFVSRKNTRWNVVYVKHMDDCSSIDHERFSCESIHWLQRPPENGILYCKVRHGERMYRCYLNRRQNRWFVRLETGDQGLASGQYAVFYSDDRCIGSGVILSPSVTKNKA